MVDKAEGISSIKWNVPGKVKEVNKTALRLRFDYDAMGSRISKDINDSILNYYTRDASGNTMAVYAELKDEFMPPEIADTAEEKRTLINYLFGEYDTIFTNEVVKPCLKDTTQLATIVSMFQSFDGGTLDTLIAHIFSEEDFGRLINSWTRDKNFSFMGCPMMMEPVNLAYTLNEHHLYGSSRLGIHRTDSTYCSFNVEHYFNAFYNTWEPSEYSAECTPGSGFSPYVKLDRIRGKRFYEMTNHLGNVLSTITDRKLPIDNPDPRVDTVLYFNADIASANDYYPFGMLMVNRTYSLDEYRFGFQGQEQDNEISGNGNSYTAEYWQYDSRLGRRWNVDPKGKPWESSYITFSNNPLIFVDPYGDTTKVYSMRGKLLGTIEDQLENQIVYIDADVYDSEFLCARKDYDERMEDRSKHDKRKLEENEELSYNNVLTEHVRANAIAYIGKKGAMELKQIALDANGNRVEHGFVAYLDGKEIRFTDISYDKNGQNVYGAWTNFKMKDALKNSKWNDAEGLLFAIGHTHGAYSTLSRYLGGLYYYGEPTYINSNTGGHTYGDYTPYLYRQTPLFISTEWGFVPYGSGTDINPFGSETFVIGAKDLRPVKSGYIWYNFFD